MGNNWFETFCKTQGVKTSHNGAFTQNRDITIHFLLSEIVLYNASLSDTGARQRLYFPPGNHYCPV